MTKDEATSAGRSKPSNGDLAPDFSTLASGSQQALASWLQSNEAIMKGSFDLAQQILAFGQARLDDDLSTLKTLMTCHDFGEMAECQKQFAEKAAAQYMDQANKLTSKLTSLITSATAPVRNVSEPRP